MIWVDQLQAEVHVPRELREHKTTEEVIEAFDLYEDPDARINFELSLQARNRGEKL